MADIALQIRLNGQEHELPDHVTIHSLLDKLGIEAERVAVEVNRRILTRSEFTAVTVEEGDEIEIVTFVGGG